MRKIMIRILAVVLITAMLVTVLAGCRKDPESNYVPPEYVFVPEIISLPDEITDIQNMTYFNDRLYFWSQHWDEETWESSVNIYTMNIDGTNLTALPNYDSSGSSPHEDAIGNTNIMSFLVDNDGNIWVAEQGYFYRYNLPDDFDEDNDEMWNYYEDLGQTMSVRKLDNTGAEMFTVDISALSTGYDWFYVSAFNVDNEGNLYLGASETIFVLNPVGALQFKLEMSSWIERLIRMTDGSVAYNGWMEGADGMYSNQLRVIDIASRGWGESIEMPQNAWNMFPGSGDFKVMFRDSANLFGIDAESGESVKVLNWIESNVMADDLQNVTILPDGRIMCTNRSWGGGRYAQATFELYVLTKTPYSELPSRIVLTLATIWMDSTIRNQIVQFNRTSQEYRIHVIDYSEFSNEENGWDAGQIKLSTDIIAGNVPDILDVSQLPFKQYVARNLLVDLYPLIDSDPTINRSDLMESVFRAAEMDGGLYRIFSNFGINTLVGNPSVVGPAMGWTMEEFDTVLRNNPQADMPLGQWLTKETFLMESVRLNMDSYVNWATGTVSFDSGEFAYLLETSNRFPAQAEMDWDNWIDEHELVAQGRQIMSSMGFGDFQTIQMYNAMFGGELAYKGFPTENKNGHSLNIYTSLAITSRAVDKNGAWAFLRTLLDAKWQEEVSWWQFPTNKAAFDARVKEAKEQDDGQIWGWGRGFEVEMKPITQADVDLVMQLIDNSFGIASYDEALMNIINEGASDFFSGRSSAQDAARIIQSRAAIYVSEQS